MTTTINTNINKNGDGLAIRGFDLVSYFDGKPLKGVQEFASKYNGATYYFVSEKNKTVFENNPDKYVPAYGGYCAIAMSEGKYVPAYPKSYTITDGKLYLFYKGIGGNTRPSWIKDEKNQKILADKHWKAQDGVFEKIPAPIRFLDKIFFP